MSDLAVNTLADRAPGIGDNSGAIPLEEQIAYEMSVDLTLDNELVNAAAPARIANDNDAVMVTTLIAKLRDQEKVLARSHEARKQPFLLGGRIVDRAYKPEIERLYNVRTALEQLLTAWEEKRRREARIERERIEAEQKKRQEEADRAAREAEVARAKGDGSIASELDAIRAQEEADRLGRQAATLRPEPIRTAAGSVAMRREIAFKIVDEKKAIAWLYKNRRSEIVQAARTIIGAHLRSMGVDAAQTADLPGVEVTIEQKASVR